MASTNQSPMYQKAEQNFLNATNNDDKIHALQEMIKECPKHKSAEKMLSQLKIRLKKLKNQIEKIKKSGKSNIETIKKGDMQVALIGFTNSGKSSILSSLTNAYPKISQHKFTTQKPEVGILKYRDINIQLVDLPSIGRGNFNLGLINSADLILITVTNFDEIEKIKNKLFKAEGKKVVLFNKSNILTESEKRKLSAKLKSKKHEFILFSCFSKEDIEELKKKIFENFPLIRIYLKEPGKVATNRPVIVKPESTVEDIAKKVSGQFASTIKEIHIWGPSSKFGNQKVGIKHTLKDKDIVEFRTR
ncbi:MAG: GTPase [Nanoarchaeota archaeon]|nr:GTPase [Nanoarchaeota archaeon]